MTEKVTIVRVLWLILPVILGGLIHILVIKLDPFRRAARVPLDLGFTLRGRRILGDNKSVRGALTMISACVIISVLQAAATNRFAWPSGLQLIEFPAARPVMWGVLLGAGYIVGEFPNSFIKRQLDIAPGEPGRGYYGLVFWLADQLDSMFGVLVFMCFVWQPPLLAIIYMILITLILHPAAALLMVSTGLKKRVG
jgi:hypothetical protein